MSLVLQMWFHMCNANRRKFLGEFSYADLLDPSKCDPHDLRCRVMGCIHACSTRGGMGEAIGRISRTEILLDGGGVFVCSSMQYHRIGSAPHVCRSKAHAHRGNTQQTAQCSCCTVERGTNWVHAGSVYILPLFILCSFSPLLRAPMVGVSNFCSNGLKNLSLSHHFLCAPLCT